MMPSNQQPYPETNYPQQYGYQYPGPPNYSAAPPMAPSNNGLAIASLICGVVGLFAGLFIPIILNLLAVIFGAVALRQIKASYGRSQGRGMAIAGIVTGAIGLAMGACVVAALIVALNDPNFQQYIQATP